jgi:hypothetical protein
MARGTESNGHLAVIPKCYFDTPCGRICLRILPDINDSKGANYIPENIPGRSSPIVTYAFSDARTISTELHFMITQSSDIIDNLRDLRIIQSLVYPTGPFGGAPFTPPPTVKFVCGQLMDGDHGLCLILRSYNVRYPTEVAWEKFTYLPYRFSISCNWEVVYACKDLPKNQCIIGDICSPHSGIDPNLPIIEYVKIAGS